MSRFCTADWLLSFLLAALPLTHTPLGRLLTFHCYFVTTPHRVKCKFHSTGVKTRCHLVLVLHVHSGTFPVNLVPTTLVVLHNTCLIVHETLQ